MSVNIAFKLLRTVSGVIGKTLTSSASALRLGALLTRLVYEPTKPFAMREIGRNARCNVVDGLPVILNGKNGGLLHRMDRSADLVSLLMLATTF